MGTFLQVLLAVVVALVVLIIAAWQLFKWWIKRKIADYGAAYELVEDRMPAPARLELYRQSPDEAPAGIGDLWRRARPLGFEKSLDFADGSGCLTWLRIGVHRDSKAGVALFDAEEGAGFILLRLTSNKRVEAVANGFFRPLSSRKLSLTVDPEAMLEAAFARLSENNDSGTTLTATLVRRVVDRIYALMRDVSLRIPPTPLRAPDGVDDDTVDTANGILRERWQTELHRALIDNFRRSSGMDASEWEELEESMEVVHAHLTQEDVGYFFDDEDSEPLIEQCVRRGLQGKALYEEVNRLVPEHCRRWKLGSVKSPVPADIYVLDEVDADSVKVGTYAYQASDGDGNETAGAVRAASARDAKAQLADMGLENARIVVEPAGSDDESLSQAEAEIYARAATDSVARSLMKAVVGNAIIWGPPLLLVLWNLWQGVPYGWGDYLSFVLLAGAVAFVCFLILPVAVYSNLLDARVRGRWARARRCIRVLRVLNRFGAMPAQTLDLERASVDAAAGECERALERWTAWEPRLDPTDYLNGLVQIYDHAGMSEDKLKVQHQLARSNPDSDIHAIDLALTLAATKSDITHAQELIEKINPAGLSELAAAGHRYARGLVAQAQGRWEESLDHFHGAIELFTPFQSNPLIAGGVAHLKGYAAVSLKRLGRDEDARSLWTRVQPFVEGQPSARDLVAAYEDS